MNRTLECALRDCALPEMWPALRACGLSSASTENDLKAVQADDLARIFTTVYGSSEQIKRNRRLWDAEVADPDTIRQDLASVGGEELLWTRNAQILSIRASPGRAHSGHGAYKHEREVEGEALLVANPKPNTSIADVVRQSQFSVEQFYSASQNIIEEAVRPIFRWLRHPNTRSIVLHTKGDEPILGLEFLRNLQLDPVELLRGFYFGAHMDDYSGFRKDVAKRYGYDLGGGECHAGDAKLLRDYGISFKNLEDGEFPNHLLLDMLSPVKRMELFRSLGIILTPDVSTIPDSLEDIHSVGVLASDSVMTTYVRETRGRGLSDDVAIVLSAFLPPLKTSLAAVDDSVKGWISRMVGAYLADTIDTLDHATKYIVPSGQDQLIGDMLNAQFRHHYRSGNFRRRHHLPDMGHGEIDLVSKQLMVDYIAAAANPRTGSPIHSSARYFLRAHLDSGASEGDMPTCTLRELILYVQNVLGSWGECGRVIERHPGEREPSELVVGFHRVPWSSKGKGGVKSTLYERLNLVVDPAQREHKLRKFYATSSSA